MPAWMAKDARSPSPSRPVNSMTRRWQKRCSSKVQSIQANVDVPVCAPQRLVADKAYGSRKFKQFLRRRGIQPVIPRKRNQKRGRPHNATLYRERNIVERFFCRLKHFRAVATRYDKRATTYLATVLLASIVLCL